MSIIPSAKIIKGKKEIEIVKETAKQLIKDFQLFDETIQFTGNIDEAYQELTNQVLPIIERLLNLDSARFFSLLYAIDLREEIVKEIIFSGKETDNTSKQITELVLERELIKVLTRKHFST